MIGSSGFVLFGLRSLLAMKRSLINVIIIIIIIIIIVIIIIIINIIRLLTKLTIKSYLQLISLKKLFSQSTIYIIPFD